MAILTKFSIYINNIMSFSFFQRKTISPSKTKEKKEKNTQKLSFADKRSNASDISDLQSSIDNSENTHSITQLQEKVDNTTGMPNDLKQGIENLSGEDMSDVKVTYNSDKPAQMQAHAYANGNDIQIAPGQEKHLPHEAWHVVQQKQDRVKPTTKSDSGTPINDEQILEYESDRMGNKALDYNSINNENIKKTNTISPVLQLAKDEKKKKKIEEKKEDEENENITNENGEKKDEENENIAKEDEKKNEGEEKKDEKNGDLKLNEPIDKKESKANKKEEDKKEGEDKKESKTEKKEKVGEKMEKSIKTKKKTKSKSMKKSKNK